MNKGVIFIHGAGLGGWVWRDTVKYLDVPFLVVNFPFRNNVKKIENLKLSDYCEDVRKQVVKWSDVDEYVVVGHSIGSLPAIYLTNFQSKNVKGFVVIGSLLPKKGESFISQLPFLKRMILTSVIKLKGTKPPANIIKTSICNDLKDEIADRVVNSYVPESPSLFFDKSKYDLPRIPSLYIKTKNDNEIPLAMQDEMIQKLSNVTTDSIESGHLPMLSKPQNLAEIIQRFVRTL